MTIIDIVVILVLIFLVDVAYSLDGKNYKELAIQTLTGATSFSKDYVVPTNLSNMVYLKVTAKFDGKTEIRKYFFNLNMQYETVDATVIKSNPESYYGKTVVGYKTEEDTVGTREWQLLYSDNKNICFIL